jgi:VanZ family protein
LPPAADAALKWLRRPLLTHWLPLLAWMGLIYWFSDQPQPFTVSQSWLEDAIGVAGHIIGYAVLAVLWRRALAARQNRRPRRAAALAWLLTVLYALSDEVHQTFVPGRSGNLPDLLIDAAGAGLGLWLVRRW